MRKLILAAFCVLAVPSAAWAIGGGGGGGGYSGATVANVYDGLSAHGCSRAGFSLFNCTWSAVPAHGSARHNRRYGRTSTR
jgi:hypothetical protein